MFSLSLPVYFHMILSVHVLPSLFPVLTLAPLGPNHLPSLSHVESKLTIYVSITYHAFAPHRDVNKD